MACIYKIYGVEESNNGWTYQQVVDYYMDKDISGFSDLLFSKSPHQISKMVIIDKIKNDSIEYYTHLQEESSNQVLREETISRAVMSGDANVKLNSNEYSIQNFIDSQFFIDNKGERLVLQLSREDYINALSSEGLNADEIQKTVENWDKIAENANQFHRDVIGPPTDKKANSAIKGTVFEGYAELNKARGDVLNRVCQGRFINGDNSCALYKNINIQAQINQEFSPQGSNLVGHIDYMLVTPKGRVECYLVKTSVEPYSSWSELKIKKYRYQAALIKRMLSNKGINPKDVEIKIIPVKIDYTDDYKHCKNISVGKEAISIEYSNGKYINNEFDKNISKFIDAEVTIDLREEDSRLIGRIGEVLKAILPEAPVRVEGIEMTAKEWVKKNWKYLNPRRTNDGGWDLDLPDGISSRTIHIKDSRVAGENKEFIDLVTKENITNNEPLSGNNSATRIISRIKDFFSSGSSSYIYSNGHIDNLLSKYIKDRVEYFDSEGNKKFSYNWHIVENSVLEYSNIIMFQRSTGEIDVVAISELDPTIKHENSKHRKNILGHYIPDHIIPGMLKSNYGNMDALRVMSILNEIMPSIEGEKKFGTLQIIGTKGYGSREGCYYDFNGMIDTWNKVVEVANKNSKHTITNNFKGVDAVLPEAVLLQIWNDIISNDNDVSLSDFDEVEKILSKSKDMSTIDSTFISDQTVQGKVAKLHQLINMLERLNDKLENSINFSDYNRVDIIAKSGNKNITTYIAKLYVEATKCLAYYNGDIYLETEDLDAFNKYFMQMKNISNSTARIVGDIIDKALTGIKSKISDIFYGTPFKLFQTLYNKKGFTETGRKLLGNRSKAFQNMYQKDSNGKNLFLFKNPYTDTSLSSEEKTFLKGILYEFYKVRCRLNGIPITITSENDSALLNAMPDNYLWVPIQRASTNTRNTNFRQTTSAKISNVTQRLQDFCRNPREAIIGFLDSASQRRSSFKETVIGDCQLVSKYHSSFSSIETREDLIEKMGEENIETNVEDIFLDYLADQIRVDEMRAIMHRIRGIELALAMKGEKEGNKNVKEILDLIDQYVIVNVFDKSISSGFIQNIESYINGLRQFTVKLAVVLNLKGMVRDFEGGFISNFTRTITKFGTNINVKDVAFAYKAVFEDGLKGLVFGNRLSELNKRFGLSNFDPTSPTEAFKSSNKGVANLTNAMFFTMRSPDYVARMVHLIARMHHDGVFDAYESTDNGIKYNWKKDKRFSLLSNSRANKSSAEYKSQQALYYKMIDAWNMEHPDNQLTYIDDLPEAYSLAEIQRIKAVCEGMMGAYQRTSAPLWENMFLGRQFTFFMKYMHGITSDWFKSAQTNGQYTNEVQATDNEGNLLFHDADNPFIITTKDTGIPVLKDVPIECVGVFKTLQEAAREVVYNGREGFKEAIWDNPMHKKNINHAIAVLTSFIAFSVLLGLAKNLYKKQKKEQDNQTKFFRNWALEVVMNGSEQLSGYFYGPLTLLNFFSEVRPVTITGTSRLFKYSYQLLTGDKDFMQWMAINSIGRSWKEAWAMYKNAHKDEED